MSIFAAKHDIITNTAAVITAAASTVYAITTTASAVIDTNAIENGESFVVNRGTSQAAANAQVTFRHSNLIYYANGYADVQATNGSVDCMMSYAALMATDWILLVNRALYDESFA